MAGLFEFSVIGWNVAAMQLCECVELECEDRLGDITATANCGNFAKHSLKKSDWFL